MNRLLLALVATSALGAAFAAGCSSDDSGSSEQGSTGGAAGEDQDASMGGGGSGGSVHSGGSAGAAGKGGSSGGAGEGGSAGGAAGSAGSSGTDGGTGPCDPNPCDTPDKQAQHRTRCMVEPGEPEGYRCACDAVGGYHDDNGICCQSNASNVNGACKCDADWIDPENQGICVVTCNENSIEGLSGWCPEGELCVQGKCQADACANVTCPPNATCAVKGGTGFCECATGLHMDDGVCCREHASNVGGACTCDAGYHDSAGKCVADSGNKCAGINPCKELHKNVCVPDTTTQGYHCDCNENYVPASGGTGCTLGSLTSCGTGFTCDHNYCVPVDPSQDQCVTDDDCHEFAPTATTTCNPAAAGGICIGCQVNSDCPGNSQCTSYSTCALLCGTDSDCPYGVCHSLGYCVQKKCTSNGDCFPGTICNNEDNDPSGGMCQRPRCTTTQCSSSNPTGTCPHPNEACIKGTCVSSCSPNPCTDINQTQCTIVGGKPSCACAPGTALDGDGKCAPVKVSQCPSSFTCESGRCVDDGVTGFQCGTSSDCGTPMNCSNALPSGTCYGCTAGWSCPGGSSCVSDYCLRGCVSASDCAPGMLCNKGYCGKKDCKSPSDCPTNYTCSVSGRCERLPCQ